MAERSPGKSVSGRKPSAPPFPFWVLILLASVALVLYWQWPSLVTYWEEMRDFFLNAFGVGVVLLVALLIAIFWIVLKKGILGSFGALLSSLNKVWHLWLGGIAYALALFGILAFFHPQDMPFSEATLGGSFGLRVIGAPDIIGFLRLVGFAFVGSLLIFPGPTWRFVKYTAQATYWLLRGSLALVKGVGLLVQLYRKYPIHTILSRRIASRGQPEPEAVPPLSEAEEVALPEGKTTAPTAPAAAASKGAEKKAPAAAPPAKRDLRRMVLDLGKRYAASAPIQAAGGWQLPALEILDRTVEGMGDLDNEKRAKLIEGALSSYGVEAKVVQINEGPTVTQFGVEPGWDRKYKEVKEKDKNGNSHTRLEEVSKTRVKVERITALGNDLALALSAPSIRIEAPVPGKPVVGIEVPNSIAGLVTLRGVLESPAFQKLKTKSKLPLALGKGAGGETVVADLTKMPHLLIAGATGSGKTVCLNTVICCLLMQSVPEEVKFIMIDPKRVEMVSFSSVPHLASPVIYDSEKAVAALRWLNQEMDNRYRKLAAVGARNIEAYNKDRGSEALPYLILVIDELADLMMTAYDEVERTLCRLAQLARATGIHLVVATQRPSVDVVTGLIKANFPTRISFAVASQVDSRTILDCVGAEKLLGRGDMLYLPTDVPKPKRLQGCYVSDAEIDRLVHFWRSQRREGAPEVQIEDLTIPVGASGASADPLVEEARRLARDHKSISPSFLQRRLRVGYSRAVQILEQLEQEQEQPKSEGTVSPPESAEEKKPEQ